GYRVGTARLVRSLVLLFTRRSGGSAASRLHCELPAQRAHDREQAGHRRRFRDDRGIPRGPDRCRHRARAVLPPPNRVEAAPPSLDADLPASGPDDHSIFSLLCRSARMADTEPEGVQHAGLVRDNRSHYALLRLPGGNLAGTALRRVGATNDPQPAWA